MSTINKYKLWWRKNNEVFIQKHKLKEFNRFIKQTGGIPYTAHGAQITPLIFDFYLFFVFMLILG